MSMHDAIVFIGPTLPKYEANKELDALYFPPAAQGDIYKAYIQYKPRFIGLIDGVFENVPSVWHKEILFCMAQGCHVIGGASMGALRAAELFAFGMVGIGKIFEGYASERLEDDDEVAVVHGPENLGYPLLTEAMVNIRTTLERALDEKIISGSQYAGLLMTAKDLHYKKRTYAALLKVDETSSLNPKTLAALLEWLPHGRIDQKKKDALDVLRYIGRMRSNNADKKTVTYRFENTQTWAAVITN